MEHTLFKVSSIMYVKSSSVHKSFFISIVSYCNTTIENK